MRTCALKPTDPASPHRCKLAGTADRYCSDGCFWQARSGGLFDDLPRGRPEYDVLSRGRWDT